MSGTFRHPPQPQQATPRITASGVATANAAAELTSGTGAANQVQPSIAPNAGNGAGTGASNQPVANIGGVAWTAGIDAYDTFTRTVTDSWGRADQGGAWTIAGTAANADVNGSTGQHNHPAVSGNLRATLAISALDTDLLVRVRADKLAVGDDRNISTFVRVVDANNLYRLNIGFTPAGAVTAVLRSRVAATDTDISTTVTTAQTDAANTWFWVRMQAQGTSPTTLRGKIWRDGTAEPTAWDVEATDSSAALQVAAGIGMRSTLAASTSNTPVLVEWDDLRSNTAVGAAGAVSAQVAPNITAATGTGAAGQGAGSLGVSTGAGTGTGAASAPTAGLSSSSGSAGGSGAAGGTSSQVAVNVGNAAGTGAASDATIVSGKFADAENAAGTGTASAPTIAIASNSGSGSGTGAAGGPTSAVSTSPGVGAGTGAVGTPTSAIAVNTGVAAGTGAANQPTVTAGKFADAENAAGTGTANQPAVAIASNANVGSGTGAAGGTASSVSVGPGVATGTGSSGAAADAIAPHAEVASGTGAAYDPTVSTAVLVYANAGVASGTGSAYDATVAIVEVAVGVTSRGPRLADLRPVGRRELRKTEVQVGVARGYGVAHNATIVTEDDVDFLDILLGIAA